MTGTAAGTPPRPPRPPRTRPARPLVMAHRGCSALRPEHTIASYARAIEDGADFIEPDLVISSDGVLIARHENNIAETTDIAARPEFAARKTTKMIDGTHQQGWFTEDFTFAELKTLRARERLGTHRPESQRYDGEFQLVSFEEIVDFVAGEAAARGRTIGLIPEIKHSTYFADAGLSLEPHLIDHVRKSPYLNRAPVIIQSFETRNLKTLRTVFATSRNIQLMQLIGDPAQQPADLAAAGMNGRYADMLTPAGLADVATYADYIAPSLRLVIPTGPDGKLGQPSGLVEAAHRAGLLVSVWTFRPENHFLAADFRNDKGDDARNPQGSIAEIQRYLATGLDAFFTDDPALGIMAIQARPARVG